MSGYLGFYGLWDWYNSQPKEVQDFLYKSCGYGIGTNSNNLIDGDHEIYGPDPDDVYKSCPDTATRFLCQHAMNAASDKNYSVCQTLLDAAFTHAKSMTDSIYQGLIAQKIGDIPRMAADLAEIERYKPILYQVVKENPGILQSELKKRFPADMENIVGMAHWTNCQEGKVRREKKGRSFQLWVV
jgi:hypothetical protein